MSYQNRCWCNTLFSVANRSGLFRKFHRNPVGDQIYGMDAPWSHEIVFFRIEVLTDNGTKIYRWSHSRRTLLRINTDNWLTGKGLIVVISFCILLFTGFVLISSLTFTLIVVRGLTLNWWKKLLDTKIILIRSADVERSVRKPLRSFLSCLDLGMWGRFLIISISYKQTLAN